MIKINKENILKILNPFSDLSNTKANFTELGTSRQIAIGLISGITAIATLPILGLGGLVAFKILTNYVFKRTPQGNAAAPASSTASTVNQKF